MADNKELLDAIQKLQQEKEQAARDAEQAAAAAEANQKEINRLRREALSHMLRSVKQLTGDLYRGEQGYKAFDGALAEGSKAMSSVGSILLRFPHTRLAGIILKTSTAFVEYTRAVGAMLDKQFELFQSLSKSGAVAADGMTGAAQDAASMGLVMKDFQSYAQLIAANSRSLALFGGTAAEGRTRFAQVSKELQKDRTGYMALGMTVNDLNEGVAGYINQQNLMGATTRRTDQQVAHSAAEYIQEMNVLTQLTGATRKELETQRAEALTQEQFLAAVNQAEAQGRSEDARSMMAMSTLMENSAGPLYAKGLRAWFSGNLQDPAARKLLLTIGADAANDLMAASKGLKSPTDAMQKAFDAMAKTKDRFGGMYGQSMAFNETFGSLNEVVNASNRANKDLTAQYQQLVKQQQKTLSGQADPATEAQAKLRNSQLELSLAMQEFVRAGAGPVSTLFGLMTWGLEAATTALKWFNKTILRQKDELEPKAQAQDQGQAARERAKQQDAEAKKQREDQQKEELNQAVKREADLRNKRAEEKRTEDAAQRQQEQKAAPKTAATMPAPTPAPAATPAPATSAPAATKPAATMPAPTPAPAAPAPAATMPAPTPAPAAPAPAATMPEPTPAPAATKPAATMPAPTPAPAAANPKQTSGLAMGEPLEPKKKSSTAKTIKVPISNVSSQGIDMIMQFEGFRAKAYKDHSQYSIGYGTRTEDPDEISGKKTIDKEEAYKRLTTWIGNLVAKVVAVGKDREWGQNQIDAMTSFAYNLGDGVLSTVTNRGKRINQETADAMLLYNKASGKVDPTLQKRRQKEHDLFVQDLPALARGGIALGPSVVGEAGAEAVIPLKGGNIPVDLGEVGEIIRQLGDLPNPDRLQQNLRDAVKVDIKTAIKDLASELAKPKPNQIEMLDLLRNIKRTHETSAEITAKIARSSMH
jgi:GH24 family phage-related lysozyme (muramidase)